MVYINDLNLEVELIPRHLTSTQRERESFSSCQLKTGYISTEVQHRTKRHGKRETGHAARTVKSSDALRPCTGKSSAASIHFYYNLGTIFT